MIWEVFIMKRTCYYCQHWHSETELCNEKNVNRKESDPGCEHFLHIPCCSTCRYLRSSGWCELGHINFEDSAKNPDDTICKTDDYAPRSSSSSTSSSSSSGSSGGCYVATCVYGSYDCPPVWTLRRYRDYVLSETIYGRLFIKLYYAVSPTLVKCFGKTKWFRRMCKAPLDKLVSSLNAKGINGAFYKDTQ